jgi:hypothetical protein
MFVLEIRKDSSCLTIATYGNKGEKPTFCFYHKENTMIDLFHKQCIFNGCNERPYYNINGEKTPLFCFEHKQEDMVDNLRSKCKENGCDKTPYFNFDGQKQRLYCSQHAKQGMINLSARECVFDGCQKLPCYNYEGQQPVSGSMSRVVSCVSFVGLMPSTAAMRSLAPCDEENKRKNRDKIFP